MSQKIQGAGKKGLNKMKGKAFKGDKMDAECKKLWAS